MRSRGLSAREAMLLSSWERARRPRITVEELRAELGEKAAVVARRLASKGVLKRIARGVYVVQPMRAFTHGGAPSAPVLVAHLMGSRPYYLGGLWALTFHRLTA